MVDFYHEYILKFVLTIYSNWESLYTSYVYASGESDTYKSLCTFIVSYVVDEKVKIHFPGHNIWISLTEVEVIVLPITLAPSKDPSVMQIWFPSAYLSVYPRN